MCERTCARVFVYMCESAVRSGTVHDCNNECLHLRGGLFFPLWASVVLDGLYGLNTEKGVLGHTGGRDGSRHVVLTWGLQLI